ncbi:MAG TPA: pilus assembly protein TadG-related protein [Verrucomicrobiae bacterium]|nr:pilus assembly protein TadG-related protein [Verrucomicrobiae bacterium]
MSFKHFARDEKAGVSVITAAAAVALIGATGLAVDVGAVYLDARRLQGAADLAALAAAQTPNAAQQRAEAALEANEWSDARVVATTGAYSADPSVPPAQRFQANGPRTNAVRVEVEAQTPLYFGRLFIREGEMTITRSATAAQRNLASFQIGSRLLALNGGVANALLSGLTGSNVSLSVMDYNALLAADVDLLEFVEILRTRLDLEAASFDRTLDADIEASEALNALADALTVDNRRAADAARALATAADRSNRNIQLGEVIDLGPYAPQDQSAPATGSGIHVKAMDLASAVLQIAGGERQVQLDLGAGVPGVASTRVWLAVGERPNNSPWLAVSDDQSVTISTAQTRVYILASANAVGLATVNVPLLIELASAQARLDTIECGASPRSGAVTLSVMPSVGSLSLGEVDTARLDNFRTPLNPTRAQLVRTPLVRVEGAAHVDVGGEEWSRVRFTHSEIDRGTIKTVSTRDVARATVSTLLAHTALDVRVGGLALSASSVTSLVSGTLRAIAAPLDNLLNGLLDLLGVSIGQADVRVNGVRCGGAALVA